VSAGIPGEPRAGDLRARRATYKAISRGTLFICIGTILLLNTLDYVPWGVWFEVLRFWPVLLISLGVRLLFVQTPAHLLCLLGPALMVATTAYVSSSYPDRAQRWSSGAGLANLAGTADLACPARGDASYSRLRVTFAAGNLRLTSEAPTPQGPAGSRTQTAPAEGAARGFSGSLRYDGRDPRTSCSTSGDLSVRHRFENYGFHFGSPFGRDVTVWEAALGSSLPVSFDINLAAAKAELDLRSFVVKEIAVEAAASHIVLLLPPPSGLVPVRVEGGVDNIRIVVPQGTCYTVSRRHVLNVLDLDDVVGRPRRSTSVSAGACGSAGTPRPDVPRYVIRLEVPLAHVAVETEGISL
jgi:hypothetical protein